MRGCCWTTRSPPARRSYRGFGVKKSFGSYVDFDTPEGSIGLGLYKRAALAKSAGIASDGGGSHRLVINGTSAGATDPDGFVWAA